MAASVNRGRIIPCSPTMVKYQRKIIDDTISDRAKEILESIAPNYGIILEEWNHDIDHVHVLFRAQLKTELFEFINAYKSDSRRCAA